jgi:TonB family protein
MEHRAAGRLSEAASILRISNCLSSVRERAQTRGRFLLDTSLSSSPISSNSTRHSVTSRIDRNSRFLSDLSFSTRHLNATPEKRKNVEKLNTCSSLLIRRDFLKFIAAATYNPRKLPAASDGAGRKSDTGSRDALSPDNACRTATRYAAQCHGLTTESQDFLSNALDQATHAAERRFHHRQAVPSLAYVQLDEGNGGIILNISEGGIAVQAAMSLMDQTLPLVRFQLMPSKEWIQAPAEVAWTGETRKMAGLRFVDPSPLASRQIREWIEREYGSAEFAQEQEDDLSARAMAAIKELPHDVPDEVLEMRDEVRDEVLNEVRDEVREMSDGSDEIVQASAEQMCDPEPPSFAVENEPRTKPVSSKQLFSRMPFAVKPREIRSAAAATASSPYVFGRRFEQSSETSLGLPEGQLLSNEIPAGVFEFQNPRMLIALLALVALASLAVGWILGPRLFAGAVERNDRTDKGQVAATAPQSSDAETSRVSNIEVMDADQQRWLIPFDAPAGESEKNAAHAPRNQALFQSGALAAPIQPRTEGASARKLESPPAIVAPSINAPAIGAPMGTQSALPASGIAGARTSISPPQPPRNTQPAHQAPQQFSQQTPRAPAQQEPQAPPEQGVMKPGVLIRRVEPFYPPDAQQKQIEGVVRLRAMVGPDGDVRDVQVESGPAMLVDSARDAVLQWRYTPTLLDGKPIESIYNVTIDFRLPHP